MKDHVVNILRFCGLGTVCDLCHIFFLKNSLKLLKKKKERIFFSFQPTHKQTCTQDLAVGYSLQLLLYQIYCLINKLLSSASRMVLVVSFLAELRKHSLISLSLFYGSNSPNGERLHQINKPLKTLLEEGGHYYCLKNTGIQKYLQGRMKNPHF